MTSNEATAIKWDPLTISRGTFVFNAPPGSIRRGQVVAVLGANGAGKSTFLRCLAGLSQPDIGEIYYGGHCVSKLSRLAKAQTVSWCPSDHHIPFAFTCLDLVLLGRYVHHQGFPSHADFEAAHTALEKVGLEDYKTRTVDQLSSGELQRAMLARCFAAAAPVLILDEPSANLDAAHALDVFSMLRDMKAQGITTIAAVHDINLANQYADTVLMLAERRLLLAGPTELILTAENIRTVLNVKTEKVVLKTGQSYFPIYGS